MAGTVEKKLAELGLTLPTPANPVANYIPYVRVGPLLLTRRQISDRFERCGATKVSFSLDAPRARPDRA